MKNVKSFYIIEIFFSYLEEKQKLKLVKKNKNLQKYLNITINNYIHFTGKYIIYESKGKGKEYCKERLIYEGEYLNGSRNGKGKEFNEFDGNCILIFEGEYLNGKRNGKGKEYFNNNGKLKFEGQYLNGKRNGKGKEYYYNGKGEYLNGYELLGTEYKNGKIKNQCNRVKGIGKKFEYRRKLFEGEYLNGKKNGKGKEYFENNLIFDGEYLDDKRNGKGKEYYHNGKLKFEGEYLNDKRWNGKGYDISNNLIYELNCGKGLIKEFNDDFILFNSLGNLIFEGEYLNGEKNGKGKEYYDNNGKLNLMVNI